MSKKDYSQYSKEELIKLIKNLERHRYGLVWEDKHEEVAEQCSKELPVLVEDKSKEIVTDKSQPTNILIEGDNYHALYTLNFTHKKKIDVIYIDPPYNTGAKDWKYNNKYVDINDSYRHSKWLSMMSKRLRLAKNLLRHDGVLICAIDDNEFHHLGALLEKLFIDFEIHCVTIIHNPRGIQGSNFSYTHEYAYFVFRKGFKVIGPRKIKAEDIDWRNLRDNGGESLRTDARKCFYPIIVEDGKVVNFGDVLTDNDHPEKQTINKGTLSYCYPIDGQRIERKWRYARQSVETIKHLLRAKRNTRGGYEIEIGKDFGTVRTVWQDSRYDSNEYGTKLVHALVPDASFDFPKSVFNTYDCIAPILLERKNALILDFFAGSGTTGHAVLLLNKEDKGQRSFILCTNNENKIAEEICYPRINEVINGHKEYPDITGILTNLKYFKTAFVPQVLTDNDKRVLVARSTELLCLAESTFDLVKQNKNDFAIFENPHQYTAIIYDEDSLSKCKKAMLKLDGSKPVCIYVFSYDYTYDEDDFLDLLNVVKIKPIPEAILNVYRKLSKYKKK